MWSPFVYTLCSALNAGNLFLQGYFLVMLGDLEMDYINPIDLCNKINKYVPLEMGLHAATMLILLFTGHFWSVLFNVPLLAVNVHLVRNGQYLLDATEIFKTMSRYKRNSFARLIFHLFGFFYYIFHMIIAIISTHALPREQPLFH